MIYAAIAVFIALTLFDLPALIKEKRWRELGVYSAVCTVAFVYLVGYVLGAEVFSPIRELSLFFEKTLGLSYALWQGHS